MRCARSPATVSACVAAAMPIPPRAGTTMILGTPGVIALATSYMVPPPAMAITISGLSSRFKRLAAARPISLRVSGCSSTSPGTTITRSRPRPSISCCSKSPRSVTMRHSARTSGITLRPARVSVMPEAVSLIKPCSRSASAAARTSLSDNPASEATARLPMGSRTSMRSISSALRPISSICLGPKRVSSVQEKSCILPPLGRKSAHWAKKRPRLDYTLSVCPFASRLDTQNTKVAPKLMQF